jgi:phage shock protein C
MKKRLERDTEQAVVAGVLSGLGDYFGQDPVLFRIVAIVFLIVTGIFPGLLFYLVAWVVMPSRSERHYDYEVSE